MDAGDEPTDDIYSREVVMARVGHLIRRKQQEIERIARIIRATFTGDGALAPEPARITRIILVGPYARRSWIEDSRTIDYSDYEFWVVVNHPLFTEPALWEPVETLVAHETDRFCAVTLAIHSKQDIRTAKATRDTYILDRLEAGITLYRARRDAPLTDRERLFWRRRRARRG